MFGPGGMGQQLMVREVYLGLDPLDPIPSPHLLPATMDHLTIHIVSQVKTSQVNFLTEMFSDKILVVTFPLSRVLH